MFVDQLSRKNIANPGFYFDYAVDDKGRLVNAFWADTTSRKNYAHFGDIVSVDATYSTNEYDMKFVPFTGINHHKGSVCFGAAMLSNETIESYAWLFTTFLKAMGGVAPKLIITDECASMKHTIKDIFPTSIHRLCMWHILMKVGAKVGPILNDNKEFKDRLKKCVWASETPAEFEEQWPSIISDYGLEDNEWFTTKFQQRQSWVPAYFKEIPLSGLARTTSRSESANSYFSRLIGYKLSLVEFWLRFDTALEEQRHKELEDDNISLHTQRTLKTPWGIEKHGSNLFTHEHFEDFQLEVLAAMESCIVESMHEEGDVKVISMSDACSKVRVVRFDKSSMFASCTCMLFETDGIPCCHVIQVLRNAKLNELPSNYVLKRFKMNCKKEPVFDEDGTLLEENPNKSVDPELQRMLSETCNKMEQLFLQAKQSPAAIQFLRDGVIALGEQLCQLAPAKEQTEVEVFEEYLGCTIPDSVEIHPPNEIRSRGRIKRILGHADKGKQQKKNERKKNKERLPRICRTCKLVVTHDSRNCPSKLPRQ